MNSAGQVMMATSASISLLSYLSSIVMPKLVSMAGTAFTLLFATLIYDWKMTPVMAICIPLCIIVLRLLACSMAHEYVTEEAVIRGLSTRILKFARLQAVLRAMDCLRDGWEPLNQSFIREHETM